MNEGIKVRADLVLKTLGTEFYVGHGEICGTLEGVDPREIATLLHKLAWEIEDEYSDRNDLSRKTHGQVRVVTNSIGDVFYEVAPDEFVDGSDFAEASRNYELDPSLAVSYDKLVFLYPEARTEDIGD